jgi:hypothetical protein
VFEDGGHGVFQVSAQKRCDATAFGRPCGGQPKWQM